MRGSATIPAGVVPGVAEDDELQVEFDYSPGSAPTIGGPPESCDPGEPPELDGALDCTLGDQPFKPTEAQEEAITEWLFGNYEWGDDEPDYPEYDD